MNIVKIVFWEEDGVWLGYLQDYPDYWTQGETLDDLKEHLKDLYHDFVGGLIPGIRKVEELVVARNEPTSSRQSNASAAYSFDTEPNTIGTPI